MKSPKDVTRYSTPQWIVLVALRMVIGWHFLYEGVAKLFTPGWSSATYLDLSRWIFRDFFQWIVANPGVLKAVDLLNIVGLFLIGLALLFGLFTRVASISGMVLLLLYYVAHPPFVGLGIGIPVEGNYLVVDKNLLELVALAVVTWFPTSSVPGFQYILGLFRKKHTVKKEPAVETAAQSTNQPVDLNRRELIKSLATLPVFGGFVYAVMKKKGWESYERLYLTNDIDAKTSATVKSFNYASLQELQGTIPTASIGDLELSRMILGGNLIGGWAHARDLIYVDKLVKSYHTKEKIFETFLLAEKCGINCFLTNPVLCRVIDEYWRRDIGRIKFISDCAYRGDVMTGIKMSVDTGAHSCYVQGGIADSLVQDGKIEVIAEALALIRQNGLPAGIGAHALETVKACVDYGLQPDYWMKTLHPINYWSASPQEQHDNIWCTNPNETIDYMSTLPQPWIAFKVLAAGAIQPNIGFQYAFANGADFICIGMYDFQIVDDVNTVLAALARVGERARPWRA
ncbi:DoxX family membrane protein [candidate division KSB1 bacterium]|nr:DoxX family protein [candidate division KSB1 bacterium]RQV99795.1 MAG: DoxX family membrane protein [candidate division KSB1 bacterium]